MKAEPQIFSELPPARRQVYYRALVDRDKRFEGIFWAGIRTTGIFCRPGCLAKKPKRENVVFFASAGAALSAGYRPCRKCQPLLRYGDPPVWIRKLLVEIDEDPGQRITDADLRKRGLDPVTLRRWFSKYHGMSFHAYLRARRINEAYRRIKTEGEVTTPALDAGYASLSGFHAAFRKQTGFSPKGSRTRTLVVVRRVLSPLGPMLAGCTDAGICFLDFQDELENESTNNHSRHRKIGDGSLFGAHPLLTRLEMQLEEYFSGRRRIFELPLHIVGTEFQKRAWQALLEIPYGATRSYREQAEMVGIPLAVRAVAGANAANRLAILIPCHRVIGKDGGLAGYGAGVWRKRYLLEHEKSVLARQPAGA